MLPPTAKVINGIPILMTSIFEIQNVSDHARNEVLITISIPASIYGNSSPIQPTKSTAHLISNLNARSCNDSSNTPFPITVKRANGYNCKISYAACRNNPGLFSINEM